MGILKRKSVITLLAIISILLALSWVNRYSFVRLYYMRGFFKLSPAKLIKEHDKLIAEDREILNQYDLFYPGRGNRDAGPFLNPQLHWQIGEVHHQGGLVLPDFIHRELAHDWVTKRPLFKKMGMKFDWLKALKVYDVWALELGSPAYPQGKRFDTFAYPIPTYRDLVSWSKLRYLYGKETGDTLSALAEVRHLMRLIWTNDNQVAAKVVLGLLQLENEFEGILTPREMGDWKFIPTDHIMRGKRYFSSIAGLIDVRLSDEVFEKNFKANAGLCLMVNEAMSHYLNLRDFLAEELRYGMDRFDRRAMVANCRRGIVYRMWEDKNWKTHYSLDGIEVLGRPVSFDEVGVNPELKAIVGYLLATNPLANPIRYHTNK